MPREKVNQKVIKSGQKAKNPRGQRAKYSKDNAPNIARTKQAKARVRFCVGGMSAVLPSLPETRAQAGGKQRPKAQGRADAARMAAGGRRRKQPQPPPP